MKYKKNNNIYALKISRGESVLEKLQEFVNKENIKFAKIEAIGAIEDVTLGYLKEDGNYLKKDFRGEYELLSLLGSIAGDKQIHMHASMAGENFITYGGHFFKGKVSGVVEMFITLVGEEQINKAQQPEDLFPTWDFK